MFNKPIYYLHHSRQPWVKDLWSTFDGCKIAEAEKSYRKWPSGACFKNNRSLICVERGQSFNSSGEWRSQLNPCDRCELRLTQWIEEMHSPEVRWIEARERGARSFAWPMISTCHLSLSLVASHAKTTNNTANNRDFLVNMSRGSLLQPIKHRELQSKAGSSEDTGGRHSMITRFLLVNVIDICNIHMRRVLVLPRHSHEMIQWVT